MAQLSAVDLEDYVRRRAPLISRDIRAAAKNAQSEANIVAETEGVLEKFAKNFDVQLHLERERTLINGRADAVYNRFVIEYEPPRSLTKSNSHRNNKHAIEQVQQYMAGLERLDRHRKERLAGAVLDGGYFIFARFRDDHWHVDDPLPVNAHSTETFLRYLLSLSTEQALTPENLVRDFGENSNTARQVVPALYGAMTTTQNKKVRVLFQQWQRQFREVSGYDPESGQLDPAEVGRLYAIRGSDLDLEQLLFALHTYYATFIKLLAVQVAHYYLMPKVGTGLGAAATYDGDRLRDYLAEMERGGLLGQLGIRNFLEGDFFGWYLDVWDDAAVAALRRLVGDLANYSLVTLDVDPEETRDMLKHLYQNLMPRELRHALGEYYTPDWLAERLLNQLGYDGNPSKRLLDPACGSGTFPVLAIKRARKYADEKALPPRQVLQQLLQNVVGYDLNPLAVISARTNYLLALGDLLQHRDGDISVPIYLADSILTPAQGADLFTRDAYSFATAVGRFSVPKALVEAHHIDRLADMLEESVHAGLAPSVFRSRILEAFHLDSLDDEPALGIVAGLYAQLLELERQGVNGIWARIVKNAFAPLFQGKFDFIAGNPPWINWESLPSEYREETAPLWGRYRLLPRDNADARQKSARSKTDLSILMLCTAVDQYLEHNGKLGFVITQTIFKTERGGRGFRQNLVQRLLPMQVEYVDDFSDIQVFEGASNRTAVVVIRKGSLTRYPVHYSYWVKTERGQRVGTDWDLPEALSILKQHQWIAQPILKEDPASPWITGRKRAIGALGGLVGKSDYYDACREGSNTRGANGIFWVKKLGDNPDGSIAVANMAEAGRLSVDSVTSSIEADLLFPLLRGQEVSSWRSNAKDWIIVPHSPSRPVAPIPEIEMRQRYPRTTMFLSHFEQELRNRPKFRNFDPSTGDFYGLYNLGSYSFSPYKVVWREQSEDLTCAVVGARDGKPVIPDHKLMSVGLSRADEAYYLCACLNSSPAVLIVHSYSIAIQISTHLMKYIKVPRFDAKNSVHHRLATLSEEAHIKTASDNDAGVLELRAQIDELAGRLWELTREELKEIQETLEAMR